MGRRSLLVGYIILCLAPFLFDRVVGDVSTFFTVGSGKPSEYFYCLPQPYQTKVDPSWNVEHNKVQLLRQESFSCRTEAIEGGDATSGSSESSMVVADDFVFNARDLERVSGAVALIQGSTCQFATWGYYIADYQLRVEKAVEAGAIGVIFVEVYPKKLPQHMDPANTVVPTCVLREPDFNRLKTAWGLDEENHPGFADFTGAYLYNMQDEPVPNPVITYFEVVDKLSFSIPALTATFNPSSTNAITGHIVEANFSDACLQESFETCIACWNGEIFLDREALVGKIAFFNFPHDVPGCFNYYYQWSILAQNVGAIGAVFGTSADHFYHVPGMYLVPELLTIPFFTIMRIHAETISHLIATDPEEVMVNLPPLVDSTGPSYFSDTRTELGISLLGQWELKEGTTTENVTFFCPAGQSTYNPENHRGVPYPDFDLQTGLDAGRLHFVTGHAYCMDRATCAQCLKLPAAEQINSYGVSITDAVVVMVELDFVCYHSYAEYSSAASDAGAYGLIIINYEDVVYTMGAVGRHGQTRFDMPSYNVGSGCGADMLKYRYFGNHSEGQRTLHSHLPELVNGTAILDEYAIEMLNIAPEEHGQMQETYVKIESEHTGICPDKQCPVGQATYNPRTGNSREGEVLMVYFVDVCLSENVDRCLDCQQLPDEDRYYYQTTEGTGGERSISTYAITAGVVQGKVILISNNESHCIKPTSMIVERMEEFGALGVIFINEDDTTETYSEDALDKSLTIPTYNIANAYGERLRVVSEQQESAAVMIRLPRLQDGVGMWDNTVDIWEKYDMFRFGTLPSPEDDDSGGSEDTETLAIALGCVGGVVVLAAVPLIYWQVQKRRVLFAYNQFDMGVQTGEAFLDISRVDSDWEHNNGDAMMVQNVDDL